MATTFLEPGGDATFNVATTSNNGLWGGILNSPTIATDFVHGNHLKSIKYAQSVQSLTQTATGVISDAGARISSAIYFNSFGSADVTFAAVNTSGGTIVVRLRISSTGVLKLNELAVQIGSDGPTLLLGRWYRISLAYTITSTTVNRFEVFVDGVSAISVTNATITNTVSSFFIWGNNSVSATLDMRSSDHYIDDSAALTDSGNIWVTAKRPNANGTTNGFVTQIGSGGSGYGSGHSPQVNERAISTTNGWSVVAVAATTEEYNIEGKATGDIDITNFQIVDYLGWVLAQTLIAETGSIVVNGVSSNISIATTITMFTKIAGSTTYPAGTGTDIGIISSATATTVSLYECGIIVAYIPKGNIFIS